MKRKLIASIFVLLSIISIINIVQATALLNIQITLPQNFKQVNIQNPDVKQYYQQNHIYLHAINKQQDESIMVVQLENELTTQVGSLKELSEEKLSTFLEQYNEVKQQTEQTILKQESYIKEEQCFIDTIFEQTTNGKKIQTEEYYTIVEGKAVIISVSFLNKDVDTVKVRQIIDSIQISSEELQSGAKDNTYFWIILAIIIGFTIVYVIKEKRNKVELDEGEKKRVLQNVIAYMNRIDYSKFKGILIIFAVTIGLNVMNLLFGIIEVITQNSWVTGNQPIAKANTILAILQNLVQLIGVIYIAYHLTKKEAKTIKKIENTLIGMLILVTILTLSRLAMQAIAGGINQSLIPYITYETQIFAKSMIYILIWYFYFRNSIRVSIYYKEKSLEQIVMEPKKGYQTNVVNKKIMEFKIIEYFKQQNAWDYASGIYINRLPKEYANSLSLSDLNSKKIIRLKRAKYYLSKKDLENPKSEQRKMIKIVGGMIAIYLFVWILLSTF